MIALREPAESYLSYALAVFLTDCFKHGIGEEIVAAFDFEGIAYTSFTFGRVYLIDTVADHRHLNAISKLYCFHIKLFVEFIFYPKNIVFQSLY